MTMTFRRAGAVLAVAAAGIVGAGAASAHDVFPTEGKTTLTVSKAAADGFAAAGISAQIPASFQILSGSKYSLHEIDDPDAGGALLHDGTITLTKGYTVVSLEDPTVTVKGGDNPTGSLSVLVGGARATIATLDLAAYAPSEDNPGFAGAEALLTNEAAGLLNQTFGTTVFAGGLSLGTLASTDVAQRVRFTTKGRTLVTLSQKTFRLLAKADVPVRATGAAKPLFARSVAFPVSGGRADIVTFKGAVKHRGGLKLGFYRTGNYKLAYDESRGFIIRSGLQKGLTLFTIQFAKKTTFGTEDALKIGRGDLFFSIEAARDLAPTLGLKPAALSRTKIGTIDISAPYVDLAR